MRLLDLIFRKVLYGAPGPTRTGTPVKETDFESVASTSSATGAAPQSSVDYSEKFSQVNARFAANHS